MDATTLEAAVAPAATTFAIDVDPSTRFSSTGQSAFRHNYDKHPLMQLDALEDLAEQLMPTFQCRFMKPGLDPSVPFEHSARPPDGRSIADVFRRIEEPGSWIALYDVQTVPAYRAFVQGVLANAASLLPPGEKILDVRGFIFLSAPPSVTPFHIDGENNFWMQIRGRKTIHLWDRHDPQVVTDRDVERFIVYRDLDNVKLDDAKLARGKAFDCGPGDGLYFPSTTPHMTRSTNDWVAPGNGVTLSIGVVFYTSHTVREAYVHAGNNLLRRAGLSPKRVGATSSFESFKYPLGRAAIELARRLRGYKPTTSFMDGTD